MSQEETKSKRPILRVFSREKKIYHNGMTKFQWTWKLMKENKVAYFMLAPYYFNFIIFILFPVVLSILASFTDFNMLELPNWVGISNYTRLFFEDELFTLAIQYTLIFAVLVGPICYLVSMLMAWFINELSPKMRTAVTAIFYCPALGINADMVLQIFFVGDEYGYLNSILLKLGFIDAPIQWFSETEYIIPLCVLFAVWGCLGMNFLSFVAGFQTVNRDMYEAAAVDGIKNRWQELWYVTLPSLRPQMMFSAVLSITGAFSFSAGMAGNPPVDYVGYTISMHIADYGTSRYEIGFSSAMCMILFIMTVTANMAIRKMLKKVGE